MHYQYQKDVLKPFETIFINIKSTSLFDCKRKMKDDKIDVGKVLGEKPDEIQNTPNSLEIKELIMTCLKLFTQSMLPKIKSGWKYDQICFLMLKKIIE